MLTLLVLGAARAHAGTKATVTAGGQESASERRAVRGTPVDEAALDESPELRELRRFEEQAFPRSGGGEPAPLRQPEDTGPLPPGLEGRWTGTGDVPAVVRTPEHGRDVARAPAAPDSEWLRKLELPELPIRWDARLLRYLDYFKSDPRGRSIMAGWIRRSGRFRTMIERVMVREGLPKDLLYLAMVESGFEPGALSRVGAGGVWQFMPGAARAYGLEVSYWVDRRRDPERAAEAAARYLKDLFVRFGSWHLAFAAYNAGYGAVLRSIASYNTNDFWELGRHEAGLPWETTLYVPKILAAAIVGHNLAAFGFADVALDPPMEYDTVEAAAGTALTMVARAAGTSLETLQALNPEMVRGRTPPDRGSVKLRVPVGAGKAYADGIEKLRGSEKVETVVLKFGETLDEIARARGVPVRELRRLNGLRDSAELRGGATIVVPAKKTQVEGGGRNKEGELSAVAPGLTGGSGDEAADEDLTMVAVPERTFAYEGRERVFYRTRDADTAEEIAEVFRVTVEELAEWNNLDPAAKLQPRMVLQLFVPKDFDRASVVLLDPGKVRVVTLGSEEFLELEAARKGKTRLFYAARAGDTLAKIARRYGLAPGDLARINRLSYSADLTEGQKIVVYSPTPELPREGAVGRTPAHRSAAGAHAASKPAGGKAAAKVETRAAPKIAEAKVANKSGTKVPVKPAPAAAKAPVKVSTKPAVAKSPAGKR